MMGPQEARTLRRTRVGTPGERRRKILRTYYWMSAILLATVLIQGLLIRHKIEVQKRWLSEVERKPAFVLGSDAIQKDPLR